VFAIEYALKHRWQYLWVEGDSRSALGAFRNTYLVPFVLRNRWHNCMNAGISVMSSRIFREGNICADKLANHGHGVTSPFWWDVLPTFICQDFFQRLDQASKLPFSLCLEFYIVLMFSFCGFRYGPPTCTIFPFLIQFWA